MRKPNKHEIVKEVDFIRINGANLQYTQKLKNGIRVVYYFNETMKSVQYIKECSKYVLSSTHKDTGWAYVIFNSKKKHGGLYEKYVDGKFHCLTGPAKVIKRNPLEHGIDTYEYWICGKVMSKEEWEVHPLVIAALVDKKLGIS